MIVVAIIGILAAIAIPAFGRYVRRARTAEAAGIMNKLWSGALTYYAADHGLSGGQMLEKQFPGPSAPAESPIECGCLPGRMCPGGAATWETPIWIALSFSMGEAHNFIPRFESSGTGAAAVFTAQATSDLDCDGIVAIYERQGMVSAEAGEVTGGGTPAVTNENE
jgi:type II secretory pathway pseudopilin PulG